MVLSYVMNKLMETDGCENEYIIVKELEVNSPSVVLLNEVQNLKTEI